MTARILDGLKIRDEIFAELKDEVGLLTAAGVQPGLAAVLVGENPASQLYVKSKIAACEQLGLASALLTPPTTVTTSFRFRRKWTLNVSSKPSIRPRTWTAFIQSAWAAWSAGVRDWLRARPPAAWKSCAAAIFPSKAQTRSCSAEATL